MANEITVLGTKVNTQVQKNLKALTERGLKYPIGYSPENAIKAAMFELSKVQDKNKKNVLEKAVTNLVTYNSIINAVNMMVVQGLDAGKKQGYFISYDDEVVFQRSYFGTVTMLERLPEIKQIKAFEYYSDNIPDFGFDVTTMSKTIKKWEPKHVSNELAGAFAVIQKNDGQFEIADMSIDEIHTSWSQSQNYGKTVWLNTPEEIAEAKKAGYKVTEGKPNGKTWAKYKTEEPNDVQSKFSGEMAKRTVINRAAKIYVNSSTAPSEFIQAYNAATENEYKEPKQAEVIDPEKLRDYASEIASVETLDDLGILWSHTIPDERKQDFIEAYQSKKDELFQKHLQESQENGEVEDIDLFENN